MRYNKYGKMAMAQIRREIDKEINIFNTRLDKYTSRTRTKAGRVKKENEYAQFARKRDELQAYVGTRRDKTGLGKGYSMRIDTETGEIFSIMKDREKAIEFLQNIHMTNAWNVYTEEGRKKWEDARESAYETFQDRYGEISREQYDNIVDIYNNLGSSILQKYGSDQAKEDYERLATEYGVDRKTFATVVEEVVKDSKGMQQYQMSDEVARKIKEMFEQAE